MAACSVRDLIGSWITDEIARHPAAVGREFGWDATMGFSAGPAGNVVHWSFLLTCKSPFLGKDSLGTTARVMANVPSEAGVRTFVRSGVSQLRQSHDRLAAEARDGGAGKAFLPASLKGRLN
jgi:hypothetical protein